jgi:lipid II:glycine glycyltransferase (peptidoglycan interpeptide bridge formation enzyme)
VHAASDTQPPDSVLLDLTRSEEDILEGMHSKCRYNCRLGTRKVEVREKGAEGVETFYTLFEETARRDGLAIHPLNYYTKLFETGRKFNSVKLSCYVAKFGGPNGIPVASIITLLCGDTCTYLYGSSSNEHRNLMGPYALQWQAIRDAKTAGAKVYDMFGIPPDDNPEHPMHGLWRFKTGFGGTIIHRPGSWDWPVKPLAYRLFHTAERLRKRRFSAKKKRQV